MSENEVKITVRPNGPFRVEGPCKLLDADGKECRSARRWSRAPDSKSHNTGFRLVYGPTILTPN